MTFQSATARFLQLKHIHDTHERLGSLGF